MKNYMLTIRIPICGIDDFQARERSKEVMTEVKSIIDWTNKKQVKLQEIFENKEPRGVWLVNDG